MRIALLAAEPTRRNSLLLALEAGKQHPAQASCCRRRYRGFSDCCPGARLCRPERGSAKQSPPFYFIFWFFFGFSLAHTHARRRWGRGGPGCADLLEEIQLQTRSPSQQFRSFSYVAGALLVLSTQIASCTSSPNEESSQAVPKPATADTWLPKPGGEAA